MRGTHNIHAFKPYRVVSSHDHTEAFIRLCNLQCFPLTSPQGTTNPLGEYASLLLCLKRENRFELSFLREQAEPLAGDKVRVMLRHDIDHDLVAAMQMSRIENALGVSASYYLHHTTGWYYGVFDESGVFHRNEAAAPLYLQLQATGAEVGLHVDGLSVFKLGVDGAEAICAELAWLRSLGLNIRGTTAHGSAPYYGAENFELFRERKASKGETIPLHGENVPLGCLSEQALGLEYEGNFATPTRDSDPERLTQYMADPLADNQQEHLRRYLHDNPHVRWGQDYTLWLYGRDQWALASTDPRGPFRFGATFQEAMVFLCGLPGGSRAVLHVHPCYYGFRASADSDVAEYDQLATALIESVIQLPETRCLREPVVGSTSTMENKPATMDGKLAEIGIALQRIHTEFSEASSMKTDVAGTVERIGTTGATLRRKAC